MALRGLFSKNSLSYTSEYIDNLFSTSNFSQRNPTLETSSFNASNINLKKSGLTNSIPISGAVKNQTKNSSLAASYGLIRKEPSNLTNEGLGLNPNINVEDEYIENLLKQIHFLNLEIKLIKEKQEEEKGKLGAAGLLSKEGRPLIDHLIDSEQKYKLLRETMDQKIAQAQHKLLLAENENKKLFSMKEFMLEKLEMMKKSHDGMVEYFENTINDLKNKYNADQVKKEEWEDKIIMQQKLLEKTIQEHTKRKKEMDLKKMHTDLENILYTEEEKMYIDNDENKTLMIENLQKEIDVQKEEMKKNFKYQECLKENAKLKERVREAEKELDDLNYKVLELEHLQVLSTKQKDIDAEERRKMAEDIEKAKEDLTELKKTNALKIEKKLKETESVELKKLQDHYKTQENLLNDVKMKFEKTDLNLKKMKTEMYHKDSSLADLLKANEELEQKMAFLNENLVPSRQRYRELTEKNKANASELSEAKDEREKIHVEMKNLQKEYQGLNASFKHFAEHVKLDDELHNIDVDELQKISNSNNQINEAINDLMSKWDGIKKFSKNSYSNIKQSDR